MSVRTRHGLLYFSILCYNESMKRCSKCGVEKPIDDFHARRGGTQGWCKNCAKQHKNKWISVNRDKVRWNTLWSKYRLRRERYEELFNQQGGKCGICKKEFGEEQPRVDHNHSCCDGHTSCGQCIRGLLCDTCNKRLGAYEKIVKEPHLLSYLNGQEAHDVDDNSEYQAL